MPTVRLSFSPAPVHVRTARLVGVAVARRAGVAEELLEEIRLAIGEACSRAVALHRTNGVDHMIDVVIDDDERFTVRVVDRAANGLAMGVPATDAPMFFADPAAAVVGAVSVPDSLNEEAVAARMGLALLAGLVDDLEVVRLMDGIGTEVSMSWPMDKRRNDT
jgi:anti-sigma regulatory factor (Ser/Thr protein kinase)